MIRAKAKRRRTTKMGYGGDTDKEEDKDPGGGEELDCKGKEKEDPDGSEDEEELGRDGEDEEDHPCCGEQSSFIVEQKINITSLSLCSA